MEGKNYKLMTCDHKLGNSITHFNSHHKHKISSKWQSDSALTDTLIIHAVVVFTSGYDFFYSNPVLDTVWELGRLWGNRAGINLVLKTV